jgi:hypothetical protein
LTPSQQAGLDVTFEMPCGHSKTIRALSLRKELYCRICYFKECMATVSKNAPSRVQNVNTFTLMLQIQIYTHTNAGIVKIQNLLQTTFYACVSRLRKIMGVAYGANTNCTIPKERGRKIRTADCSVIYKGRRYLIEIDDAHISVG